MEQYPDRTRPQNINIATKLLYAAFGIELTLSALNDFLTGELFALGGLFGLVLVFWIYWALIRLIDCGHKKALIIFSAFIIMNWGFVVSVLIFDIPAYSFALVDEAISPLSNNFVFNALTLSSSFMNIMALYLLYQKPSLNWFRQRT